MKTKLENFKTGELVSIGAGISVLVKSAIRNPELEYCFKDENDVPALVDLLRFQLEIFYEISYRLPENEAEKCTQYEPSFVEEES